jgi:hypothetical protein
MFGGSQQSQSQHQSSESLRLEGFDAPLRGKRILVVGPQDLWLSRFSILEADSLYKGVNILVIQDNTTGFAHGQRSTHSSTARDYTLLHRRRWDVVFRVREAFDFQMLATYVQNAAKPARILWALPPSLGTMETVPKGLWQRWGGSGGGHGQDVTLVGGTENGVIGGVDWQAVFFPLRCEQSVVDRVLIARGSGLSQGLRQHLSELAGSGAALAWTNIDEADERGALNWYDPGEGVKGDWFTKKEAADLLEMVAKWLGRE